MACLPPESRFPTPVPSITYWICFLGCYYKLWQTWWLKLIEIYFSQFQRPEVHNQGGGRIALTLNEDAKRGPSLSSSSCWSSQCARFVAASLYSLSSSPQGLVFLCIHVFPLSLLRAFAFGFRTYKGDPEWFHVWRFLTITLANTLFPNKVTFTACIRTWTCVFEGHHSPYSTCQVSNVHSSQALLLVESKQGKQQKKNRSSGPSLYPWACLIVNVPNK